MSWSKSLTLLISKGWPRRMCSAEAYIGGQFVVSAAKRQRRSSLAVIFKSPLVSRALSNHLVTLKAAGHSLPCFQSAFRYSQTIRRLYLSVNNAFYLGLSLPASARLHQSVRSADRPPLFLQLRSLLLHNLSLFLTAEVSHNIAVRASNKSAPSTVLDLSALIFAYICMQRQEFWSKNAFLAKAVGFALPGPQRADATSN